MFEAVWKWSDICDNDSKHAKVTKALWLMVAAASRLTCIWYVPFGMLPSEVLRSKTAKKLAQGRACKPPPVADVGNLAVRLSVPATLCFGAALVGKNDMAGQGRLARCRIVRNNSKRF